LAAPANNAPVGVLIVDDSSLIRMILQRIIEAEPGFKVLGTARDGQIAVERCRELKPDIITLDVEMPNMSGLEALPLLLEAHRSAAVVMISSLTSRGAKETIDALLHGAADYITKPTAAGPGDAAISELSATLVPKLKALAERTRRAPAGGTAVSIPSAAGAGLSLPSAARLPSTPSAVKPPSSRVSREPPVRAPAHGSEPVTIRGSRLAPRLLAIGSSTGGPVALAELLTGLPGDFPLPILIAQHMPEVFTRLLAERLSEVSQFKVREGVAGEILRPGEAWIAPGNQHMTIEADGPGKLRLALSSGPPVNSCRPSIDVLFESVAKACGPETLALALTGMGHDGRDGARAIRQAGGQVLAQDEASSVVWGIPGAVVGAGLATGVFALKDLAGQVWARLQVAPIKQRAGA
jgi:two-component system, chemotaxis family, protein-glutamate methylesterase/glutaminase